VSERNYRKEYDNYHSKPEQRANRSSRNKARRKMAKAGYKLNGRDVDHKDGNPRNNSPLNLRIQSPGANRARNK
jgi:HNH endonuclease